MGSSQRRRVELLERRGSAGRRLFVVSVPYGDARAERVAEDRLVAERGLTDLDTVVFLQRFAGGDCGSGLAVESALL